MQAEVTFVPASSFSLDALGDIFTRSFEGYFYPGTLTAAMLAARARIESLDLHHSLVLLVGGEPAGVALLGLRGDRAWCGGLASRRRSAGAAWRTAARRGAARPSARGGGAAVHARGADANEPRSRPTRAPGLRSRATCGYHLVAPAGWPWRHR